jgi:hypothetical protein
MRPEGLGKLKNSVTSWSSLVTEGGGFYLSVRRRMPEDRTLQHSRYLRLANLGDIQSLQIKVKKESYPR